MNGLGGMGCPCPLPMPSRIAYTAFLLCAAVWPGAAPMLFGFHAPPPLMCPPPLHRCAQPFGPVLPIMRVKDVEEAVDHVNANRLALQASYCSRSFPA